MEIILQTITKLFGYILKPFSALPPFVGLCFISAVTGVLLLKLYGLVSRQKKIRRAKDEINAHLLGIVLYKDDIRLCLKSQAKMLLANIKYLKQSLLPLVVLLVVCLPILGQLNLRYGYQPFNKGDKIPIIANFTNTTDLTGISITTEDGLKVLTPALRIQELNQVVWKVQPLWPGTHKIEVGVAGSTYNKELVVGDTADKVSSVRLKSFLGSVLYPGENLLPEESPIDSIEVPYRGGSVKIFGHNFHWLLIFCVVSIIAGLSFKRILNVEI
jgi:uncharacterized membrane protein (DUF106 family)